MKWPENIRCQTVIINTVIATRIIVVYFLLNLCVGGRVLEVVQQY